MAQESDTSLKEGLLADFQARSKMELDLAALFERFKAVQPDAILVAYEKDGQVMLTTFPKSYMLAKGIIMEIYDAIIGNDVGDE